TEEIIIDTYDANVSASIAADLDGDGDVDVISATNFQNFVTDRGVFWHENDGSGNFTRRQVSSAGVVNRVVSLVVSDIDGDGDQDVLAITNSTSGNNVSVLVNNGSQGFSVRAVGAASFGTSVFAADVDSDGDIDVLSASRNDDKIGWFENQGNLNFQEHVITTNANSARGVFAVDMDGDGDTDVLSASNQDSTVAWYENDGGQNFTERVISTDDRGAFAVFAADYDGDGDIDVLSAAAGDGELVLHVNDGEENFTKRVVATGLTNPRKIFAADLDGDGDLDALAASATESATLAWFENFGLPSGVFGVSDVFLNGNRSGDLADPADLDGLRTQETNLGNLVADASLATAKEFDPTVVASFRNSGSIRASIGTTVDLPDDSETRLPNADGFITQEDIESTLAFNNGLTLLDITRAELVALLEEGISALPGVSGDFPQISGLKFSFDDSRPAGDRVVSAGIFGDDGTLIATLAEGGEVSGDPEEVFRIVTSDFLANSGSPVLVSLTNPSRVDLADLDDDGIDDDVFSGGAIFSADGTEQDALAEYLLANFDPENGGAAFDAADTSREFDERIQNLSFRSDGVLPPSEVFDNGAGGIIGFASAVFADVAQGQLNADDVVFAETTRISSIAWSGVYLNNGGTPAAVDDFTILIYADDNGQPASGDPIAEFVVGNNVNRTQVNSRFSYTADIDFVMDAGVTYWISLLNDTTGDPADFAWGNQTGGGNQHFSDDDGVTWENGNQQPDFRLFGVPVGPPAAEAKS
ncbi:MAG: FG-GAP-like repeat-containing protein, partial [Planctomycetota bacterium]